MKYRRINFYGGPSSSKSTSAAKVFSELKILRKSVEFCTEFVKSFAYSNRDIKEFDQLLISGMQFNEEYKFLSHGVEKIITDSPLYLSSIYSENKVVARSLETIVDEYERSFPSLNIFLNRGDRPYDPKGRFQSHEEAVEIDKKLLDFLSWKQHDGCIDNLHIVDYNDYGRMMEVITKNW